MDRSQEAANQANIRTAKLTKWLVLIAIPTLIACVIAAYFAAFPRQPSTGASDTSVTSWIPFVLLVASAGLISTALILVALRQWRTKPLRQANSKLTEDLATAKREWGDWERKYHQVNNEKIPVETERNNLKNQVAALKQDLATAKEGHELELTTERIEKNMLKDALKTAKHDLKEAFLKVQEEINQRDNWMRSYYEKENRLIDLKWLTDLAEAQAKDISNHVVIMPFVSPTGEVALMGTHLGVYVWLRIRNESVFNLSIKAENVTGHFFLHNVRSKEKAGQLTDDFRPPIHNLKPGEYETIYLEQPLREFEAEIITKSADTDEFWIGNMHIPISINNDGFQHVESRPLRLPGGRIALKDFKRNSEKL